MIRTCIYCGKTKDVQPSAADRKYCNMECYIQHTQLNIVGKRFGHLVVLEYRGSDNNKGSFWLCRCDCGKTKVMRRCTFVTGGEDVACGCRMYPSKAEGEAARNIILRSYKHNAERRGLCFTLTNEEVFELFKGHCLYCGVVPSRVTGSFRQNGTFTYNGMDRKDSKTGYTKDNCVSCCEFCNKAKRDLTTEEFIKCIRRLHTNLFSQ